jgi:hypothetical protein
VNAVWTACLVIVVGLLAAIAWCWFGPATTPPPWADQACELTDDPTGVLVAPPFPPTWDDAFHGITTHLSADHGYRRRIEALEQQMKEHH